MKLPTAVPQISSELIQDLGNVINEGLSNSFRHGTADKAEIRIDIKSGKILVLVSDNGSGPTKGKAGLGSEWFNTIAGSNWTLTRNSKGGADLNLEINWR
ncbi:MAG: ATP-binding protein [Candidatus Nanopelagicaceae bacterium]